MASVFGDFGAAWKLARACFRKCLFNPPLCTSSNTADTPVFESRFSSAVYTHSNEALDISLKCFSLRAPPTALVRDVCTKSTRVRNMEEVYARPQEVIAANCAFYPRKVKEEDSENIDAESSKLRAELMQATPACLETQCLWITVQVMGLQAFSFWVAALFLSSNVYSKGKQAAKIDPYSELIYQQVIEIEKAGKGTTVSAIPFEFSDIFTGTARDTDVKENADDLADFSPKSVEITVNELSEEASYITEVGELSIQKVETLEAHGDRSDIWIGPKSSAANGDSKVEADKEDRNASEESNTCSGKRVSQKRDLPGFLVSSLLKSYSPRRVNKLESSLSASKSRTRDASSSGKELRGTKKKAEKKACSKKKKRIHRRKAQRSSVVKKVSREIKEDCRKPPSFAKRQINSDEEKIVVVNFRKNGSRLVSSFDREGTKNQIEFRPIVDENLGHETRGFPEKATKLSDLQQDLLQGEQREGHKSSNFAAKIHKNETSRSGELIWDIEDTVLGEPFQGKTSQKSEPSLFYDRLIEVSEKPIFDVPHLESNENFASREFLSHQYPRSYSIKGVFASRPQSETRIQCSSERSLKARPKSSYVTSPTKSILVDPRKRPPGSKSLAVSFDFSQPDPLGEEANSYPVLPLYSTSKEEILSAPNRLRFFFEEQEECKETGYIKSEEMKTKLE